MSTTERDLNRKYDLSKLNELENEIYIRNLVESIGICHLRLNDGEKGILCFLSVLDMLNEEEHRSIKRIQGRMVECELAME